MVNYKEILRLNHEGYSQRQIEASVHCSRHTVRDVLSVAEKHNLLWPLDESVTNEQIETILFPERYSAVSMYLEPDYTCIHTELAKRGVTLTLLWYEYVQKAESLGKKPYMITQFGDKYRTWARITKATMRIHHKPGEAMQVDWAGDTLPIYDSETDEITPAYLFTVIQVLRLAQANNLTYPLPDGMTDKELADLLYPVAESKPEYKMPDYEYVHKELQKSGVTLNLLWLEYCEVCRSNGDMPYQLTQFKKYYRDYAVKTNATMHLNHKPGEMMQVDWAGDTAAVIDTDTGEAIPAYVFVATLPYSGYSYVEAFFSMNQECWIAA